MFRKKIFIPIVLGVMIAALATSNLVEAAADLNQAVTTLPSDEEWSIMARAAVNQISGQTYLRSPISDGSATDYEKRILAITAIGENPRTFGSEDFISKLQNFFDGNQIGDPSLLNDDIFGILALTSSSISDTTVSKSRQFILSHQNSDGGWGYATNVGSDSNTTAMAVAALTKTGSAPSSAFDYLARTQDSSGGFGFIPGQKADGASTAWVITGFNSSGRTAPASAVTFLETLQTANGSFKWKPTDSSGSGLVTAYAVIALSGKGLPINITSATPPVVTTPPVENTPTTPPTTTQPPIVTTPVIDPPVVITPTIDPVTPTMPIVHVSISYPDNKIFAGDINYTSGMTALDGMVSASNRINLLYQIKQTSLGQFVDSIDGYKSSGSSGWQYAVNGTIPDRGASEYPLQAADTVQWFYANPGSSAY